jgi:hypothetical protein
MARREKLTDKMIRTLDRPQTGRRAMVDPELNSHYLRIPASGPIISTVVVKKGGKQKWESIGAIDDLGGSNPPVKRHGPSSNGSSPASRHRQRRSLSPAWRRAG